MKHLTQSIELNGTFGDGIQALRVLLNFAQIISIHNLPVVIKQIYAKFKNVFQKMVFK